MTINIKNFNYSRAQTIGCGLQKPLFKVLSHVATAASGKRNELLLARIAKVAIHSFLAILLIVPAGFASLLGKTIVHFSKTKINTDNLHLTPPPLEAPEEDPENAAINVTTLFRKYYELPRVNHRYGEIGDKRTTLRDMCGNVQSKAPSVYPENLNKRNEFYELLSLYLKGIIRKMEDGAIPEDRQREILLELAEASTRCYPTWLEVASKIYAEVYGKEETVQIKLLRLIQDYKETLILNYGQNTANTDWHALSYMRNILGEDLGLNTSLNRLDPYGGDNSHSFGKRLSKWFFLQLYGNSNHLISRIQDTINAQDFDASYHDYLKDILREQDYEDPDDYVTENFFDEDYKITHAGVSCMLKSMGILR